MKSTEFGEARIFGMRHGEVIKPQSNPLVYMHQELPDTATLSPEGRAKVRKKIITAKERGCFRRKVVIFSSERPRTLHTATIAKVILESDDIKVSPLLNNRNVQEVLDNLDLSLQKGKIAYDPVVPEADWEMEARTITFVDSVRREFSDKDILLVSHTEILEIAQAHLLQVPKEQRADLRFDYAELRRLTDRTESKLRF